MGESEAARSPCSFSPSFKFRKDSRNQRRIEPPAWDLPRVSRACRQHFQVLRSKSPCECLEGRRRRARPQRDGDIGRRPLGRRSAARSLGPGEKRARGAGGSEKTSLHIFRATTVCRGHRQGRLPASTTARGRVTRRAGRSTPQDVGGGKAGPCHASGLGH